MRFVFNSSIDSIRVVSIRFDSYFEFYMQVFFITFSIYSHLV